MRICLRKSEDRSESSAPVVGTQERILQVRNAKGVLRFEPTTVSPTLHISGRTMKWSSVSISDICKEASQKFSESGRRSRLYSVKREITSSEHGDMRRLSRAALLVLVFAIVNLKGKPANHRLGRKADADSRSACDSVDRIEYDLLVQHNTVERT